MKNNQALSRYELEINGLVAFADYRTEGDIIIIDYVFAPPELRGAGAAGSLMKEIVGEAMNKKMKIHPVCSYAAVWLRKHKEYHDLIT
jgi:hypothetical protein